jgi:hypothetical protein
MPRVGTALLERFNWIPSPNETILLFVEFSRKGLGLKHASICCGCCFRCQCKAIDIEFFLLTACIMISTQLDQTLSVDVHMNEQLMAGKWKERYVMEQSTNVEVLETIAMSTTWMILLMTCWNSSI